MQQSPILIIGKTGKTGVRVEQRLRALGYVTRGVSRSSSPAFDWEDPTTWPDALTGARQAYVTYYPDLAVPGAESAIRAFVTQAARLGVEHIVLLSGRGESGAERAEQVLMHSGLQWNVVRANWFMQNFSEGFMIEGILNGELVLPAADIPEPFVDVDDIADVAVAALTRPALRNQLFAVSGPRAMTFAQCVAEISDATGYPVRFQPVPIDSFIDAMRGEAMDDNMLWLMRELFSVVLDGRNSEPVDGVMQALGRPATDFRQYVEKVMAQHAWDRDTVSTQG